jgi:ABC-type Fe3+-siderophore transport system permease subunit
MLLVNSYSKLILYDYAPQLRLDFVIGFAFALCGALFQGTERIPMLEVGCRGRAG